MYTQRRIRTSVLSNIECLYVLNYPLHLTVLLGYSYTLFPNIGYYEGIDGGNEMRSKKLTRKQKEKRSMKPKGNSKYALKVAARVREARKLGLPPNSTYPEIWAYQRNQ